MFLHESVEGQPEFGADRAALHQNFMLGFRYLGIVRVRRAAGEVFRRGSYANAILAGADNQ